MNETSEETLERLIAAARQAAAAAYAPYSRYAVGAAVLDEQGGIHRGCNVENASYGLSCCAERNAVFAMVAGGGRRIVALALYTPTERTTRPCGACRQVILEFGPTCRIVCACAGLERHETTLAELLPESFGAADIE